MRCSRGRGCLPVGRGGRFGGGLEKPDRRSSRTGQRVCKCVWEAGVVMGFKGCVDAVVKCRLFLVGDSGEPSPALKFLLRCDGGNVVEGSAVADTSWVHWRIASLDGPGLFCPLWENWKDLDWFDLGSSWWLIRICGHDRLVSRDPVTQVCTCLRNLFLASLAILVVCELGLGTVLALDVTTLEILLPYALFTEGGDTWGAGDVVLFLGVLV